LLFLNKYLDTTPKKLISVKMVLFTCIFRYALSFLFYSFNELKLKFNSKTIAVEHFSECKYKTLFLAHKKFFAIYLYFF
jgi:hypothetical protein